MESFPKYRALVRRDDQRGINTHRQSPYGADNGDKIVKSKKIEDKSAKRSADPGNQFGEPQIKNQQRLKKRQNNSAIINLQFSF